MIRPATQNLFDSLMMDIWPRMAAQVDFGLDNGNRQQRYEALYYPIRKGEITLNQLEAIIGDGPAITKLVQSCKSNPHKDIIFTTVWEDMGVDLSDQMEEEDERESDSI